MAVIPKTMRAAVYRGPNNICIETVPVPRVGPHELLVKVAVCGVCPTDIKKIQYGTVPPPRIFGHETAGTIVRTGPRVRGYRVGDRVALHHHIPCLDCHACRHRAFAQCTQYKRTGITAGFEPAGGGFAEYVRVMPFVLSGVVKIPARNTFEEGAMLEPVNTVLKAVRRLNLLRGDLVLVAGQGPIGLMFTRLLKLEGMRVVATDLMDTRLALARRLGAKWAVHPSELAESPSISRPAAIVGQVSSLSRGTGSANLRSRNGGTGALKSKSGLEARPALDAAIIAVPSDAVVRESIGLLRGAGQVLLFAHTRRGAKTDLDLASVCVDEIDVLGSYSADFTIQRQVAGLVFSRQLDVRQLITHRFPLQDTAAAVRLASAPSEDSLKIVVIPGQ